MCFGGDDPKRRAAPNKKPWTRIEGFGPSRRRGRREPTVRWAAHRSPRVGGPTGCHHGKALAQEFRDDVVRVARNRDDGVTIEQIATDFGVHPMTPRKWMRQADVDDGATPGKSTGESAELRELRRRNRLLEQENEVLRRAAAYLSQSNLTGKSFTRS